jgi:hypothetical protein
MAERGQNEAEGHELRPCVCVMIHAVRILIRKHKPHLDSDNIGKKPCIPKT